MPTDLFEEMGFDSPRSRWDEEEPDVLDSVEEDEDEEDVYFEEEDDEPLY